MSFNIPTLGDDGRLQNPQVLSQIRQIVQSEAKGRGGTGEMGDGPTIIVGPGRPDIPFTTGGLITTEQDDVYSPLLPVGIEPGTFYLSEKEYDGAILWVYRITKSWYELSGNYDFHDLAVWDVVVGSLSIPLPGVSYEQEDEDLDDVIANGHLMVYPSSTMVEVYIDGLKSSLFKYGPQRIFDLDTGSVFLRGDGVYSTLVAESTEDSSFYTVPAYFNGSSIRVDLTSLADIGDDEYFVIKGTFILKPIKWPELYHSDDEDTTLDIEI